MPATTSFQSVRQLGFDKAQLAHLNSQIGDIALHLRPNTPNYIDGDGELRIGRKGSLAINPDGRWYDHEEGVGSRGAISLTLHLMDAAPAEVRQYLVQRLTLPRGTFAANPISDEEAAEKERRNTDYGREALGRIEQPIVSDTHTYTYSERRGGLLNGPQPACVAHLPVGRTAYHESAIVGILTSADGGRVSIQLGHLMADGTKSPHLPQRNKYNLVDKEKAAGATFAIPATPLPTNGQGVPDIVRQFADTYILCEGLEDALSLHRAFPYSAIGGFPGGIGHAIHLKPKKGTKILVFADGDAPDSAARKSLTKGVDALIIAGADVLLAMPPLGKDANDLLVDNGVEAIRAVAAAAVPAVLSPKGRLAQIRGMPWVDFKLAQKRLAKELNTNSPFLEAQWKAAHQTEQPAGDGLHIGDDTPWFARVNDIAAVCDAALAEVQRYVVAHADDLAVLIIWSLGAHFVHHQAIHLTRYARLEIGGEDIEVGKTTALEITGAMLPRTLPIGGSITAAAYYRLVDAHQASVLIDEAHDLFKSKDGSQSHLMRILRSGHTRNMAYVLLTEPSPDGKHVLRQFSTWTAIAYTVVGRLPDAGTRSRSISIRLVRALEGEVTADYDEGDSPVLNIVRQKFTRWVGDQSELPMVPRPEGFFNRRWNNWAPIMRVAALVGGEWPDRLMRAAKRALVAPAPTNSDGAVAALTDIRSIFDTPVQGKLRDQIVSERLCQEMADLEEPSAEWKRIHRGQPITPLYLRERLRGLLNPPGSSQLQQGNRNLRGYKRAQFEDAFRRYLPPKATDEDAPDHISATPPARPAGPADPLTPSPESQDFGGFAGSAGESAGPDSRPADSISRPKARPSEGESAGQRVQRVQQPPSPHVFPDGVVPPWEDPPDSATAPAPPAPDHPEKGEEFW